MNPKTVRRFALLHLLAAVGVVLFPLYVNVARIVAVVVPGCVLHDFFHLYCPLCGGTRAMSALLRLDFLNALTYNPLVVLFCAVFLVLYGIAWWRLLHGKDRIWCCPDWLWISALVLLFTFGIFRNVLLVGWGIDSIGDLSVYWNHT